MAPAKAMTEEVKEFDPNYKVTNNNAIDVHVGRRVRLRRTLLGMSQEQLGDALNITFQQVQKYERGSNRVSSSRLWDIGQIWMFRCRFSSTTCRGKRWSIRPVGCSIARSPNMKSSGLIPWRGAKH